MSLEDDLRNSLQRRARDVAPTSDVTDVHARAAGHDRRTMRWLVVGLVVVLFVGPLTGFALGQSFLDDSGTPVSAARAGDGSSSTDSDARSAPISGFDSPIAPDAQLETLFRRTTDDGIVIRAYRYSACDGVDAVVAGLSNDAAVARPVISGGRVRPVLTATETMGVSGANVFGIAEGSPAWWIAVGVSSDIVRVRAEAEGASDEMEVVDGFALLAHGVASSEDPAAESLIAVEGFDAAGALILSMDIETYTFASFGTDDCAFEEPAPDVPEAMPAAGDPPADPDGASTEIEDAFTVVYDGTRTIEDKAAFLTAATGITQEQIDASSFAEQVRDASAHTTEIVFTSPTSAAVRYDIRISDYSDFQSLIGQAQFVDGRWKVAQATYCQDLALAGLACSSQ